MDMEVKTLINDALASSSNAGKKGLFAKAFRFLADNRFFGSPWTGSGGSILIPEDEADGLRQRLIVFLSCQDKEEEEKLLFLKGYLEEQFPETMARLATLQGKVKGPLADDPYELYDFMAAHLQKEIPLMNNQELDCFAREMDASVTKKTMEEFALFTGWMKLRPEPGHPVSYTIDIQVKKRTSSCATQAYDLTIICSLYYFCFCEEFILQTDVYRKACNDPRYSDTFLYECTHLLCALRDPDIDALPFPLISKPADVLDRIRTGALTDKEAVEALRSVMDHLGCIAPVPNKTHDTAVAPEIYLFVPISLEPHMGRLFLICAAHHFLSGKPFLSQRVTDYWGLVDLFGDEMAEPFRERDMSSTAFSRSFLQGLAVLAAQEGEGSALQRAMLGYQLASRARSHVGGYGTFSETTAVYLQDNALTGLGPAMIARELFERGVLSSIPSMLLSLVSQGTYETLTFTQQTKMIQELGLDALEVEHVMELFRKAQAEAENTICTWLGTPDQDRQEAICSLLRRVAVGMAPSKDDASFCFMIALNRPCPFAERKHCLGCTFCIPTRAVLFQLGGELKRISRLRKEAAASGEHGEELKYRLILEQYLVPTIANMLSAGIKVLGEEAGKYISAVIHEAAGFQETA